MSHNLALLERFAGFAPPAPQWFQSAIGEAPDRSFVDVDGTAIETLTWGDRGKPGLLFLHGACAHGDWWSFIAPFFAADFRVAALSFSGMGRSGWRDQYSYEGFADEALAVARQAGLFDSSLAPVVCAHSFGARVSCYVAARLKAKIGSLILIDGPSVGNLADSVERKAPYNHRIYDTEHAALQRFRFHPEQQCENLYIVDWIARKSLREADNGQKGWTWCFDPKFLQSRYQCNSLEQLNAATCRVSIITSSKSRFKRLGIYAQVATHIHNRGAIVEVPDSDHHLLADQPLALVAALRALCPS